MQNLSSDNNLKLYFNNAEMCNIFNNTNYTLA